MHDANNRQVLRRARQAYHRCGRRGAGRAQGDRKRGACPGGKHPARARRRSARRVRSGEGDGAKGAGGERAAEAAYCSARGGAGRVGRRSRRAADAPPGPPAKQGQTQLLTVPAKPRANRTVQTLVVMASSTTICTTSTAF